MTENPLIGKKSSMDFQMDGFFLFSMDQTHIQHLWYRRNIVHDTSIAEFARKLSGVIGISIVASHLPTESWIDQICFQKQWAT